MKVTVEQILKWTGGKLLRGRRSSTVRGISIDSRTIRAGELFLALAGKNYDGHDFIPSSLERKAAGLILRDRSRVSLPLLGKGVMIQVPDPEAALVALARGSRSTLPAAAVAITGSNGKTTTKNILGAMLGKQRSTLIAPASYNNRIGVALTILAADESREVIVFELGMNRAGEIRELGNLCRPALAVILNAGSAHIGCLGGRDQIARAKAEILETLEGEKKVVLNYDDPRVRKMGNGWSGETVTFGFSPAARVRASRLELDAGGSRFDLTLSSGSIRVKTNFPGRYNVMNCLAAAAAADALGISPGQIKDALGKAELPPLRMERMEWEGALLINDDYNANPDSMRAALSAWKSMEVRGRRIMVSGDMMELGAFAEKEHELWGQELAAAGLDYLVFVGPLSRRSARAAGESGFPEDKIHFCPDNQAAAEILRRLVQPRDSVLLKASRKMALEEIGRRLSGPRRIVDLPGRSTTKKRAV